MAIDIQMKLKSEKRFLKFANFGEYLFWSYANLQMLLPFNYRHLTFDYPQL